MSLTSSEIKAAIEEWAEVKVDEEVAARIEYNLEILSKWPEYKQYGTYSTNPDDFDRDEIRDELIDEFYSEGNSEELPGLGMATVVQQDRVNDEQWIVFEIEGLYYMISTYYSSYGENYWHDEGEFVRVVPKQVTKTVYEPV